MKKLIINGLNLASALFMFKFALPKLSAAAISVKTFTYFGEVLPVNGTFYMYFVGLLELVIGLIMIALIFINNERIKAVTTYVGYFLLTSTLIVALLHEYFVRPAPVPMLVIYSAVFLVVCAIQFAVYRSAIDIIAKRCKRCPKK